MNQIREMVKKTNSKTLMEMYIASQNDTTNEGFAVNAIIGEELCERGLLIWDEDEWDYKLP